MVAGCTSVHSIKQCRDSVSLRRFPFVSCLFLLFHIRQAAPQFGAQVSRFGRNVNGLGALATHPAIEFLSRSPHSLPLAGDWHARFCPTLCRRDWQTQEARDFFPALERPRRRRRKRRRRRSRGWRRPLWHSASPVRSKLSWATKKNSLGLDAHDDCLAASQIRPPMECYRFLRVIRLPADRHHEHEARFSYFFPRLSKACLRPRSLSQGLSLRRFPNNLNYLFSQRSMSVDH